MKWISAYIPLVLLNPHRLRPLPQFSEPYEESNPLCLSISLSYLSSFKDVLLDNKTSIV